VSDADEVIDRCFAAVEAHDLATVAELYAPDLQVWHSYTRTTLGRDGGLAFIEPLMQPGVDIRYERLDQLTVGDRTARRHLLHVALGGKHRATIPVSVHLTVRDGQITRLDEFADRALINKLVLQVTAHVGFVRGARRLLKVRQLVRASTLARD
jgi:ketosteroid isomerase-like protein